jgi:hypothetical protein
MGLGPRLWCWGSSGIQWGPARRGGGEIGGRSLWANLGEEGITLGKYVTVFQAEIYAILACVYEIQTNAISEKYISICSDSQAALKALQAAKTASPLVWQCQRALNDISTYYSVGLFLGPRTFWYT